MVEHALFPTLVAEDFNPNNDVFKEIFFKNVFKHFTDGYSHEGTGALDLQTDPNLQPIYEYATLKAKEYVAKLEVNPDMYDFNIVKSWLNCTSRDDNPVHSHADAHFCFAYYVNVPTNIEKSIRFFQPNHPNNLYAGMLDLNVTNYNVFNSLSWGLLPKEGTIFLFPGHLKHHVSNDVNKKPTLGSEPPVNSVEDLYSRRISIVGDIVLTFKEKTALPLGIQPVKNWRSF